MWFLKENSGHCTMENALVVCGQIFEHSSNYFTIWKITKMLISEPNFNGFVFCKKKNT